MNLAYLGIAWLLGLILAKWLQPLGLMIAAVGWLCFVLIFRRRSSRFSSTWVFGFFFCLAAGRYLLTLPAFDQDDLAYYNNQPRIVLTGVISEFPQVGERQTSLRLNAESITLNGIEQPVHGETQLSLPNYPSYSFGDRLRVSGALQALPVVSGSQYREYLARRGIYSYMRPSRTEILSAGNGPLLLQSLNAFRSLCRQNIDRLFAEPYAALLSGILLGLDNGIPKNLYDQFNITGTSHIIAISGFNMSLVAIFLLCLTKRLFGMKYAPWAAFGGIWLYALLVGAGASVLRAAGMAGIAMLALLSGRPNAVRSSLAATGILLTAITPQSFLDVDFQLSFMATLGLVVLSPRLEEIASSTMGRFFSKQNAAFLYDLIKDGLLLTLAAQIFTLPITALYFGRISLIGLMTNLLVLPVQPLVMIGGATAALLGFISGPLARLTAMVAWLPLAWTVAVVRFTAGFPMASLTLNNGEKGIAALILFFAMAFIAVILVPGLRARMMKALNTAKVPLMAGLAIITALTWLASSSLPDGRLHVRLLNVGQGDAILIITPAGKNILIDGGPSEQALLNELGGRLPFWEHTLSLVVNTHPQADHLTGLLGALKHYQVDYLMENDSLSDYPLVLEWRRQVKDKGIPIIPGVRGTVIRLSKDIDLRVLHPQGPVMSEDENQDSIVLLLEYGETRFLFSGDVNADTEERLLSGGELPAVNVLKVAHHGSSTGLTPALLEKLSPSVALIPVGENRFGQPDPAVLEMLDDRHVPTYRTDRHGAIEIISDGRNLWLKKDIE
jgi:competence protein ComEC